MDITYLTLLREIAHVTELTAEQVMDLNKKNNDLQGYKTAKTMRNDYGALYDKLRSDNFDSTTLIKAEYAKLMVGALIVSQQLEQKIKAEQKVLQGYKVDTIPKLERIVGCETDEDAVKLAEEIFQPIEETNT